MEFGGDGNAMHQYNNSVASVRDSNTQQKTEESNQSLFLFFPFSSFPFFFSPSFSFSPPFSSFEQQLRNPLPVCGHRICGWLRWQQAHVVLRVPQQCICDGCEDDFKLMRIFGKQECALRGVEWLLPRNTHGRGACCSTGGPGQDACFACVKHKAILCNVLNITQTKTHTEMCSRSDLHDDGDEGSAVALGYSSRDRGSDVGTQNSITISLSIESRRRQSIQYGRTVLGRSYHARCCLLLAWCWPLLLQAGEQRSPLRRSGVCSRAQQASRWRCSGILWMGAICTCCRCTAPKPGRCWSRPPRAPA